MAVLIKENFDETQPEEEPQWETDRSRMGTVVSKLGETSDLPVDCMEII